VLNSIGSKQTYPETNIRNFDKISVRNYSKCRKFQNLSSGINDLEKLRDNHVAVPNFRR
jgi:hypothetical protein